MASSLRQVFAELEETLVARGRLVVQPPPTPAAAICGLTIREPWATLIARSGEWSGAGKLIECRSWQTSWRGVLLIHSAGWWSAGQVERTLEQLRERGLVGGRLPDVTLAECREHTGNVIARAELVRCRELADDDPDPWAAPSSLVASEDEGDPCYAWELRNVVRVEPLAAKGRLKLWEAPARMRDALRDLKPRPVESAEEAARRSSGDKPETNVNRLEQLRRAAAARNDPRASLSIGEMASKICGAVDRQDWRKTVELLEHVLGRLDQGEWQIGAWVPCPGTNYYRTLAPKEVAESLDYLRSAVYRAREAGSQIPETSQRALDMGVRQFDADADERARAMIERLGL